MQIKRHPWLLTTLCALLLSACSTYTALDSQYKSIQTRDRETADLADVTADALSLAERVKKDRVLVVFDIDNTLLAMEQGLGADQWYEWQKELANEDRCSKQYVGDRFAVQGAVFYASAMRPTQDDAAQQVKAVQKRGISVIALTSRGPDYRLQTFRELRRNGYNFSHSALGHASANTDDLLFIPIQKSRMSRYEDGVFMTAGQHKGKLLYALLQRTDSKMPSVIVMADDKRKNLDAVKETFSTLGIPVHAWRYSGEDETVKNFDPEQAHQQWKSIEQPLRQLQKDLGPDNYDLSTAVVPTECQ